MNPYDKLLSKLLAAALAAILAIIAFLSSGCRPIAGVKVWHRQIGPFDEKGFYIEAWADDPPPASMKPRVYKSQPSIAAPRK